MSILEQHAQANGSSPSLAWMPGFCNLQEDNTHQLLFHLSVLPWGRGKLPPFPEQGHSCTVRGPQAPDSSSWLTHLFLGTSISMMEKEPSPLRHVGRRSVRAATPRSTAGGFSWDLIAHPRLISTISFFHLRFKRSRGQGPAVLRPMVLIHFIGRSLNGKVILWLCPFVRPLGLAWPVSLPSKDTLGSSWGRLRMQWQPW